MCGWSTLINKFWFVFTICKLPKRSNKNIKLKLARRGLILKRNWSLCFFYCYFARKWRENEHQDDQIFSITAVTQKMPQIGCYWLFTGPNDAFRQIMLSLRRCSRSSRTLQRVHHSKILNQNLYKIYFFLAALNLQRIYSIGE